MLYPALDVAGIDAGFLEAAVDDFAPTAIEPNDGVTTVFFTDAAHRDAARRAVIAAWPSAQVESRDVDDGDWARRSQENLTPITVGRITIVPPWHKPVAHAHEPRPHESIAIVIAPSMGFGTGHHATTRLCLAALQTLDLRERRVLDVGYGSGVLALAARALGADDVTALDYDADAVHAAAENVDANPTLSGVHLVVGDLRDVVLEAADVVTANLMGALLVQTAELLQQAVRPEGTLIVSGLLQHERTPVVAALSTHSTLVWEQAEEGWLALAFNRIAPAGV